MDSGSSGHGRSCNYIKQRYYGLGSIQTVGTLCAFYNLF